MVSQYWVLLATFAFISITHSVRDFPDLQGPYCSRTGCCDNRLDECASPILGTLCYCDEFCDRDRGEDCCPDFWSHCKGIVPPSPAPIKTCHYNGTYYYKGKTMQENCNTCKCEEINGRMEMLCEQNTCIIDEEIIDSVNQRNHVLGWRAAKYQPFWGRTLMDGVTLRLGTFPPHRSVLRMHPVKRIFDPNILSREFDANVEWPGKLMTIQDQGWCGSSWAISTVAVASDRFSVISKGLESPKLSAQHLLSCDKRGQQSCTGGYLDKAWMFMRKFGVVNEECLPYIAKTDFCNIPRGGNLATARCIPPPSKVERKEYYRVGPAHRMGNEIDIMYEIMHSGPVQATMKVYHDFFMYKGGIYKHSEVGTDHRTGYHSVRIVGWGEEKTYSGIVKYWKVANSWGHEWGEGGYFRIVRGTNECEIESFVLGVLPLIARVRSDNDI